MQPRAYTSYAPATIRVASFLVLFSLGACVAPTDQSTSDSLPQPLTADDPDYDRIADLLGAKGFSVEGLRHLDDDVFVEGDMIFSRDSLLTEADEFVEKGYSGFTKTVPRVGTPFYNFQNWTRCVRVSGLSTSWQNAVNHAIDQWAAEGFHLKRWSSCTFAQQQESIGTVTYYSDSDKKVFASASVGGSNACLGSFRINRDWTGNCGGATNIESLSDGFKRKIAMHELGHSCSLLHPPEGFNIIGTATGTAYSTVMEQGCSGKNSLTSDDKLSAAKLQNR